MMKNFAWFGVGFVVGIYGLMRYWHTDRNGCMNALDKNTSNW